MTRGGRRFAGAGLLRRDVQRQASGPPPGPLDWGEPLIAAWNTTDSLVTLTGGSPNTVNTIGPAYGLSHASLNTHSTNKPIWTPSDGAMGGQPSCNLGYSPQRGMESASAIDFGSNTAVTIITIGHGGVALYPANTYGAVVEFPAGFGATPGAAQYFYCNAGTPAPLWDTWGWNTSTQARNALGREWVDPFCWVSTQDRALSTNEPDEYISSTTSATVTRPTNGNNPSTAFGSRIVGIGSRQPVTGAGTIPSGINWCETLIFGGTGLVAKLASHVRPYIQFYYGSTVFP